MESTIFLGCQIKQARLQILTLLNGLRQNLQLLMKQCFDVHNKTLTLLNIKAQEERLHAVDVKTERRSEIHLKRPRTRRSLKVQIDLETEKLSLTSQDTRNDVLPEKIKSSSKENFEDKNNERAQCTQWKGNPIHRILIALRFFIFALIIEVATSAANYRIEGCYPCTELMNREWRQDLPDECTSTIYDCGKCLEGYHANRDDEICFPKAEINVTDSSFAVVPNGASLTLSCHFNHNVDCVWKRRGFVVEISNRYSYTQANNGVNTKDCSIKISPFFDKIDYGLLECESMTDGSGLATSTSTAIQIYSEKAITMDASYSKIFSTLQETVIIQCTFKQSADCAWSRRGHLVEVKGRYSYLNAKNGIGTTDCSIKIASFHEIDVAAWQCQSVADSSTLSISSTAVELLRVDVKYPAIVVGPNTTNALIDDKVNLKCQFDAEVQCSWQHNGTEANIKNRHYFKENSSNHLKKDCSIEILSFAEDDVGNWTCTYKGAHTNTKASTAMLNIAPMHAPTIPKITINNTSVRIRSSTEVAKGDEIVVCVSKHGNPAPNLWWKMENEHFESNKTETRNGFQFDVKTLMNLTEYKHLCKKDVCILRCIATHPMIENGTHYEDSIEVTSKEENHNQGSYLRIVLPVGLLAICIVTILLHIFILLWKRRKFDKPTKLPLEVNVRDPHNEALVAKKASSKNVINEMPRRENSTNVDESDVEVMEGATKDANKFGMRYLKNCLRRDDSLKVRLF